MPDLLPIVEIVGPWLPNKGDGLMLLAVADRLAASAALAVSTTLGLERLPPQPPLSRIAWAPDRTSIRKAAASGSAREMLRVCREGAVLTLAPRSVLRARGIAAGRDIAALLDCSGFAYGDAWATARVEKREAYYRRLKRQGARIVVLPQAFGPFEDPLVRHWSSRLLQHCDLVFARDEGSLRHLASLGLDGRVAGVVPDITHLLRGHAPADRDAWARRVCIVPNTRMVDRTSPETGDRYKAFLLQSIRLVREAGLEPHLLLHESYDVPLAQQIRDEAGVPLPVTNEEALASKGILGACYAVIGSRYHALVSALSQGVPAIGTSWSHKYGELYRDYGCSPYLVSLSGEQDADQLESLVRHLLDAGVRHDLAAQLSARAAEHKARVNQMWSRIESLILPSAATGDTKNRRRTPVHLSMVPRRASDSATGGVR